MPISEDSTKYAAFNTCYGTFKFLRFPKRLKIWPNIFQLFMDKVFRPFCIICVIWTMFSFVPKHLTSKLRTYGKFFGRFGSAGLKVQPSKCQFVQQKFIFLGHEISREGIKPLCNKVDLILNYYRIYVKELRRIMGLFSWFRKFIPNYSAVAEPILKLTKKNTPFEWSNEQDTAFKDLKRLLQNSPVLSFPRYDLDFRLVVDTSCRGLGYMLYQNIKIEILRLCDWDSGNLHNGNCHTV